MRLAKAMQVRLAQDVALVAAATGGIYDRDVRRSGWEAVPEAFDERQQIKPLLMADESGLLPLVSGHPAQFTGTTYVWVLGPRTTAGRETVERLVAGVTARLSGWHEPTTGTRFEWAGTLGERTDDNGVVDRVAFTVRGVHPQIDW